MAAAMAAVAALGSSLKAEEEFAVLEEFVQLLSVARKLPTAEGFRGDSATMTWTMAALINCSILHAIL